MKRKASTLEGAWDEYYSGDPTIAIEHTESTPSYDALYPRPLPRHVEIMKRMAIESIEASVKRGDKKAYFFEDGCGSGRYRCVAQQIAEYASNKGRDIHIIWIGNDISQAGLDLYKSKLLSAEEGFESGAGYERSALEPRAECVHKGNLTYKFIKSTERTTAQELERKIGVIVENSFDV
jgi:hypothetical protein